jgi:ABC-type transport system involved in multi-copper enzyme maturation permease subunit
VILIAGLVLLLLPYAIVLITLCWPQEASGDGGRDVMGAFFVASIYSLVLCQLTAAFFGGNAIAGERADRSAEFMAYLPVSRPRRLAAKLTLAAAATAVLWAVNLLVLLGVLLVPLLAMREVDADLQRIILTVLGCSAITGLTFFGVGWLVSSLQSSPAFAVCAGLITPAVIAMGLRTVAWVTNASSLDRFTGTGYAIVCPIVAVVCFSIGTWYYLRRVEP